MSVHAPPPGPAHNNGESNGLSPNSYGNDHQMTDNKGFLSNILKDLSPEQKQTKDGQPPKRRGPKPDSKPALTRRQELNRQAQRTHRERKEMYIKALEQEVLRLKEVFSNSTRERDAIAEENRKLKDLLAQHGIAYDFGASPIKFQRQDSNNTNTYGLSSSGSISGSYGGTESSGFSPPPPFPSQPQQMSNMQQHQQGRMHQPSPRNLAQLPDNRLDYDQIGIDFVLTLERPCMDHMQYLMVRSHNVEGQPMHHPMEPPDDAEHEHMSGHALMATAPPMHHIMETPGDKYPYQMPPDLKSGDLSKLLDLSARLPIGNNGEITPIMAWTMIFSDERLRELDAKDLERIKSDLGRKVRCYGFGAVLEEFEVRDALWTVFSEKDRPLPALGHLAAAPAIPAY